MRRPVRAMILAAGLGTRLRPLSYERPKALFPVANRPVIEFVVRLLKRHGFNDLVINLHYLPNRIVEYLGDGSVLGMKIDYSFEEELLGTAGALRKARKYLGEETFLVINCDVLTDVDLSRALEFHRERRALATLILIEVEDPSSYGMIGIDDRGRIGSFLGRSEVALKYAVYGGICFLEPEIFELIPLGCSGLGDVVFPGLLREGKPFFGYLTSASPSGEAGYWLDVGTLERYRRANWDVLGGRFKAVVPSHGKGGRVHPSAKINEPVIIGLGSVVGEGAEIGPHAILGRNCSIGKSVVVRRSIFWDGVRVGDGARVDESIVGDSAVIRGGCGLRGKICKKT
ncbi:MAG: NDP-sugar synthase [Actinomycetota bacterium]|nr:NDP-sugar synthase [Actinomycetota bacterium]